LANDDQERRVNRAQHRGKQVKRDYIEEARANGGKLSLAGLTTEERWEAINQMLNWQIAGELEKLDAAYPEDNVKVAPPPGKPGAGLKWERVPKAEAMAREALRLSAWKQAQLADIARIERGEEALGLKEATNVAV
jgi:hypothetical protein